MTRVSWMLLFTASLGTMAAQTVNWIPSGSPTARDGMGLAYDGATRSVLLFGGVGLGDTWVWRGGWLQAFPATSPPGRNGTGMVYDASAGNVVLFGGTSASGADLNDTWIWDGTTWTQQFPSVSPPARVLMSMAYDAATANVVLFGGSSNNDTNYFGDTWIWNGIAKTWTQQNPAASPSARRAPMAYDPATNNVVLFGGGNGSGTVEYTDTWTWNGATWTQQFPASTPTARTSASMMYDDALGAIVLFGGFAGSWPNSLNDTWIWKTGNWRQIHPATTPPNRYNFGMAYDPVFKALLMFGGYSSTVARGDTWLLAIEP